MVAALETAMCSTVCKFCIQLQFAALYDGQQFAYFDGNTADWDGAAAVLKSGRIPVTSSVGGCMFTPS